MQIGFFNYYEIYNNNKMFKDASSPIGDDLSYPSVHLAKFAKAKNIKVSTIDTKPLESYDAILFMEFPTFKNKYFRQLINSKFENLYLLIFESEVIRPDNWDIKSHKYFKKIFTWNDEFVDNKKYFKINYSHKIPVNLKFGLRKKNKLCTLIAGHKFKSHPLELYSERVRAIRWFERHHPEDFDLYGMGWDRHYFQGPLSRLNRLKFLTGLLKPDYPSYKGAIKSKRKILQKYKFAICYENVRNIPGYITEKIFDCFFAGCVPVYFGAPNVTDHIPADTFIDKRNFKTYEELYGYLKNMSDNEYIGYLDAIKNFIKSDKIYPFSAECFAETIVNEISGKSHV
jgi:hypothetical protein